MVVLSFVLVTICAVFPLSSAFNWQSPQSKTSNKSLTLPNDAKSVDLKWEWNFRGSEYLSQFLIYRYESGQRDDTLKLIAAYYAVRDEKETFPSSSFELITRGTKDSTTSAHLTIKDVLSQGTNKDGTTVDVMKAKYIYYLDLTVVNAADPVHDREITLTVKKIPSITNDLKNKYISSDQKVTLQCNADGNPKPDVRWSISRTAGGTNDHRNSKYTIDPFERNDAGLYTCIAKNDVGNANVTVLLQYTGCDGTGCTVDTVGIEMTKLKHDTSYDNPNSDNYQKLKNAIETECMTIYSKTSNVDLYSCEVTEFRSGSLIAEVKMVYSSVDSEPKKPLLDALKTGTFANQAVKSSFVSPTGAPTQSTQPDKSNSPTTIGSPDSGAREEGELGTGAIVAIVVVFSIIFVVIIVVLVVCMLKRRRPAPRKQYKEDGKGKPAAATTAPLTTQHYRDPTYDNDKPKEVVYADLHFQDRYPNEGGPPPQYTPSNYAEVRPSQADQNESAMEWDKSVRNDEMWI